MDRAAVADLLGVLPATVSRWLSAGAFPEPAGRYGRSPVWTRGQVDGWVEAHPAHGTGRGRPRKAR